MSGRWDMGNRTGRRKKKATNDLTETGAWGDPRRVVIQGGSRFNLADDEGSSVVMHTEEVNFGQCKRCNGQLEARVNYCRDCYDERYQWMPYRPTRKKRPKLVRRDENISGQNSEPLFLAHVRSRGEGIALPHRNFSNLPSASARQSVSSTSESSETLQNERKNEWLKRRDYCRLVSSSADTDDESVKMCVLCGKFPGTTYVLHGSTAHGSLCCLCGSLLLNHSCPWCGYVITESRSL